MYSAEVNRNIHLQFAFINVTLINPLLYFDVKHPQSNYVLLGYLEVFGR